MPNTLIVNNIIIDENETPKVSGAAITSIDANGINFWNRIDLPNPLTFTASGIFTVPLGVSEVTICMCGGGGSGGANNYAYGGQAGESIQQTISVTSGEQIPITIGDGGASQTNYNNNGLDGTDSSFGAYVTVLGGLGGYNEQDEYQGKGLAGSATCGGTWNDGTWQDFSIIYKAWGGEAGTFGSGGNGSATGVVTSGGIGAGGGGGSYTSGISGAGGRGQCVISWTPFNVSWSGSSLGTGPEGIETSGSNYRYTSYGTDSATWLQADINGLDIGDSFITTVSTYGIRSTLNTLEFYHSLGGVVGVCDFTIIDKFSGSSIRNSTGFSTSGGLIRYETTGVNGDFISLT